MRVAWYRTVLLNYFMWILFWDLNCLSQKKINSFGTNRFKASEKMNLKQANIMHI